LSRHITEAGFTRLYERHSKDILAYALRRTNTPEDAGDIVAETFLVAWRRFVEIPKDDEARLWLYGTARYVLKNQLRGDRRRANLSVQLRADLARRPVPPDPGSDRSDTIIAAMNGLAEPDRELLRLIGWEGLTPSEAARVLDLSPVAARVRLHRARKRLRTLLDAAEEKEPAEIRRLQIKEKA
jgi:RNA polymerase sigma-70 factor (ECF subfamily)